MITTTTTTTTYHQVLLRRDKEHQVAWNRYFSLMEVLRAGSRKIDLQELLSRRELTDAFQDLLPPPQIIKGPSDTTITTTTTTTTTKPDSISLKSLSSTMSKSSRLVLEEGSSSSPPPPPYLLEAIKGLPRGLEEKVDDLLLYAILPAFIPTTMASTITCQQAYQWYLNLPPCGAKYEHYHQATTSAKRYAQNLHYEGYHIIRDLVPLSRHGHIFNHLGMRDELVVCCKAIIMEIRYPKPAAPPSRQVGPYYH